MIFFARTAFPIKMTDYVKVCSFSTQVPHRPPRQAFYFVVSSFLNPALHQRFSASTLFDAITRRFIVVRFVASRLPLRVGFTGRLAAVLNSSTFLIAPVRILCNAFSLSLAEMFQLVIFISLFFFRSAWSTLACLLCGLRD